MAAKKALETFSKALIEEVQKWGEKKQTGVNLRYMMEFGAIPTEKNLLISSQFLHKELPIRIARRAIELENVPFGLSQKPAVLKHLHVEEIPSPLTVERWMKMAKRGLTPLRYCVYDNKTEMSTRYRAMVDLGNKVLCTVSKSDVEYRRRRQGR